MTQVSIASAQALRNTDDTHALNGGSLPKKALDVSRADPTWFKKYMLYDFADGARDYNDDNCVDCWGLLYTIYRKKLSIQLPSYDSLSPKEQQAVSDQIHADTIAPPWFEVSLEACQPFDMVIFKGLSEVQGRYRWLDNHVGIITNPPYVMHIEDSSGVMFQSLASTSQSMYDKILRRRFVRVVRHEEAV